jgi:hypothetical protein
MVFFVFVKMFSKLYGFVVVAFWKMNETELDASVEDGA